MARGVERTGRQHEAQTEPRPAQHLGVPVKPHGGRPLRRLRPTAQCDPYSYPYPCPCPYPYPYPLPLTCDGSAECSSASTRRATAKSAVGERQGRSCWPVKATWLG